MEFPSNVDDSFGFWNFVTENLENYFPPVFGTVFVLDNQKMCTWKLKHTSHRARNVRKMSCRYDCAMMTQPKSSLHQAKKIASRVKLQAAKLATAMAVLQL